MHGMGSKKVHSSLKSLNKAWIMSIQSLLKLQPISNSQYRQLLSNIQGLSMQATLVQASILDGGECPSSKATLLSNVSGHAEAVLNTLDIVLSFSGLSMSEECCFVLSATKIVQVPLCRHSA